MKSIERPQGGERAVLVHVYFPAGNMQEDLSEFKELVHSAGAELAALVTTTRQTPDAKYFIGVGKVEEVRIAVLTHRADIVIFNHPLTPGQERNLEKIFQCRVISRIGLILDIFAQRARSFEGKLQVELALLNHLSTRLVRGWTHLERQRGGIGLRGPGETQLETDRRLLRARIRFITERLTRVKKQRALGRRARQRATVPTIALVGYTNAGKSTLFNQLTGADVYAANRLFATLDPTLRRTTLPQFGAVILADTVGFIRHLPPDLIDAFHATLEEVAEADLLLHVVDANEESKQANRQEVDSVLQDIQAADVPQILVYNKIDLCPELAVGIERDAGGKVRRVFVSAAQNEGIDFLKSAMTECLGEVVQRTIILSPEQSKLRAQLFALKAVIAEEVDEKGYFHLMVRLSKKDWPAGC